MKIIKQFKKIHLFILIGIGLFLMGAVLATLFDQPIFLIALIIGWILIFIGMTSFFFGLQCPMCNKKLGIFLQILLFSFFFGWLLSNKHLSEA